MRLIDTFSSNLIPISHHFQIAMIADISRLKYSSFKEAEKIPIEGVPSVKSFLALNFSIRKAMRSICFEISERLGLNFHETISAIMDIFVAVDLKLNRVSILEIKSVRCPFTFITIRRALSKSADTIILYATFCGPANLVVSPSTSFHQLVH